MSIASQDCKLHHGLMAEALKASTPIEIFDDRGDREVSRLRDFAPSGRSTPGSWCVHSVIPCSMSSSRSLELGRLRGGDWDRREAGEADRCRLGRAEGDARDPAVSTQHGVGTSRAVLIYTTCSAEAVQRISENTCRMARDTTSVSAPPIRSRPSSASKGPH